MDTIEDRRPAIERLRDAYRVDLLEAVVYDGYEIPEWAKSIPGMAELERLGQQIRQEMAMQSSIAAQAQPQDAQALSAQPQDRAWVNGYGIGDTVGAFGVGMGRMVNDTAIGGLGAITGALGRGVEYISPFSGEDREATQRRELLRALGVSRRYMPETRVYNDSWLTKGAKGILFAHNKIDDALEAFKKYAVGDNPSILAELFEGAGSSTGYALLAYLAGGNLITKALAEAAGESLSEAGGFLADAYRRGQYDQGAISGMLQSFGTNFLLNGALDLSIGHFSPIFENVYKNNPIKLRMARGVGQILNEILQEPGQQVIEQAVTNTLNKGGNWSDFWGELKQSAQQFPELFMQLAPTVTGSTAISEILLGLLGPEGIVPTYRFNRKQRAAATQQASTLSGRRDTLQGRLDDVNAAWQSQQEAARSRLNDIYQYGNEEMDTNPDVQSEAQDLSAIVEGTSSEAQDLLARVQGIDAQIEELRKYAESKPSIWTADTPVEVEYPEAFYNPDQSDNLSLYPEDEGQPSTTPTDQTPPEGPTAPSAGGQGTPSTDDTSSPMDDIAGNQEGTVDITDLVDDEPDIDLPESSTEDTTDTIRSSTAYGNIAQEMRRQQEAFESSER